MTRRNNETVNATLVLNTQAQDKLIFIFEQKEYHFDLADYGLSVNSTQSQVINAVSPAIREHPEIGVNVDRDEYTLISSESNLFLMPKPEQG